MADEKVVKALEHKKWRWTSEFNDHEGGTCVMLTKKPNRYTTHCVEVDENGLCNGMPLNEFLKTGF